MKVTPGPWKVRTDKGPRGYDQLTVWGALPQFGDVRVGQVDSYPGGGTASGNAHLLAAAPDLLAACKNALGDAPCGCSQVYREDPDDKHKPDCVVPVLRKAIAKAEGK
jgi:hypothetical protein